jgi:hypothetical protein
MTRNYSRPVASTEFQTYVGTNGPGYDFNTGLPTVIATGADEDYHRNGP